MARDPLEALARLRRHAVTMERRRLAERLAGLTAAEARQAATAAALVEEAAGDPADFAAWLPRGLAESRVAAAQDAVAAARAEELALELLRERRAAEEARKAARRAQAALDEAAARRRRDG